jgi:signal transduction histidine kinase
MSPESSTRHLESERRTLRRQRRRGIRFQVSALLLLSSLNGVASAAVAVVVINGQVPPFLLWPSKAIPLGFSWTVVLAIVTVLWAFRLQFGFSRPLEELTDATAAVSRGDLDTAMPPLRGGHELEDLARGVESMRERLVQSITKLDRHNELLDAKNERMSTILASLTEGVVHVDGKGRVLEHNPASARLLETLVGSAPVPGASIEALVPGLPEGWASSGDDVEWEIELGPAGQKHWVSVRASRVQSARPAAEREHVVVLRDVTQAKDLERLKREFLSVVTHELKTPLTAIEGYTKLLLMGKAGELAARQKGFVQTIQSQTHALKAMIQDLLDITRLEGRTLPLEMVPLSAEEVTRTAFDSCRGLAETRGIVFVVDAGDVGTAKIHADSFRVQQVLGNLLGNAFKFTESGGRVTLACSADEREVRFVVEDTGRGIPADALPHLFTKFYQVEKGDTRVSGGAGLGLYITRELVTVQDGIIGVESTVGQGSRFTVRFPRLSEEHTLPGAQRLQASFEAEGTRE